MQDNQDHIDKFFRDKLNAYEVVPPENVWSKISGSLADKHRKSRKLWIIGLSAAASLLFAIAAGWYFVGSDYNGPAFSEDIHTGFTDETSAIIQPSTNKTHDVSIVIDDKKMNNRNTSITPEADTKRRAKLIKELYPNEITGRKEMGVINTLISKAIQIEQATNTEYTLLAMGNSFLDPSDMEILASNIKKRDELNKNEKRKNTVSVGLQGSPEYRFVSSDTEYASDTYPIYQGNIKNSQNDFNTNVTGGITVAYSSGSRFSIQSGFNYGEISQNPGQVGISFLGANNIYDHFAQDDDSRFQGPSYVNQDNNLVVETQMGLSNLQMPLGANMVSVNSFEKNGTEMVRNYRVEQKAGYLEIPLIVRYKLIDNRIGLHLLGGVNTNFLLINEVSLRDDYEAIANGKIEGLNPLTFTSSVGLGINYSISRHFLFSIEPTLKMHLNSINNQSYINVRPMSVGLFTGLTYQF
jgi:hypothetical protein